MIQYSTQFTRMLGVLYTSTTQKFPDSAAVAMLKQISTKKRSKDQKIKLGEEKKKGSIAMSQRHKSKNENEKIKKIRVECLKCWGTRKPKSNNYNNRKSFYVYSISYPW